MRKSIGLLVASCLITGITLTSCKSDNEKVEAAKEDVIDAKENELEAESDLQEAKTDSVSDYTRLKAETNALVAKNETRIAEFKVKLKTENAANQKKFQVQIDNLEAKNNELKRDLNNYADAGKEKWDTFKTRVKKSVDDIDKDIEDYKTKHNY